MALIRKYGNLVQQEVGELRTGDSDAQDLRRVEEGRTSSSLDEEDLETTQDSTSSDSSSVDEQNAYLVDTLEVVDPGVSAAGHLSNIGNSLIFPNIPGLYDRRPVIDLPAQEVDPTAASTEAQLQLDEGRPSPSSAQKRTDEDDLHLDAYVHELLTKRQKFKRAMQGVWAFLCTPIGVIAGIYGFLVVFGGAALVLFLIGAIDGGKNKDFWVEVFSQFENGLFTIPGVGLIYWRVRDTIVMARIAHYQHLTWRLRKERGLPKLIDKHDLPSVAQVRDKKQKKKDKTGEKGAPEAIEMQIAPGSELQASQIGADSGDDSMDDEHSSAASIVLSPDQVLSPRQAQTLHQLQTRFAESQSWYRPHETFTHHAFSIGFALLITILNDLNSLFQCLLCGYMWGYATHYHDRPAWSTGTFMPCSFLAGIGAAVLIWKGGERSKKKREVEEKLLAAFAKDIDAQVERMRRENEANAQTAAAGTSGVGAADLATESEKKAAAKPAAQAGDDGQGLDLDQLATEITEKQA